MGRSLKTFPWSAHFTFFIHQGVKEQSISKPFLVGVSYQNSPSWELHHNQLLCIHEMGNLIYWSQGAPLIIEILSAAHASNLRTFATANLHSALLRVATEMHPHMEPFLVFHSSKQTGKFILLRIILF